ncbi:DUF2933 domain-containing protein [Acidovorax sp. JHL-3]|jgi:hypothetical protein|uniref:DUF2933 domain-containing protein n=1 Tax=Acidovorax sp. JHL-3 TaxID=1276755 RepID=UPI0004660385
MDQPDNDSHSPSFWRRPAGMALAAAALIAGFYLLREHWGHVLGYWPYLLLLACPLMHLMHGHGGHGGHGNHAQTPRRTNNDKE